jgi:phage/plasmid-like protein (TIGR03299 family)
MSANIYEYNGIVSMAYAGQTPWHGTGQVIESTDTPGQIMEKCGFGFTLDPSPAGYVDVNSSFRPLPGKVVLKRSDTGEPVSIVSDKFKVHQPYEILDFFLEFAKSFGIKIETAGVLGRGERYWALARTGVDADLNGNGKDVAHLYALLATAADGSMRTTATPTGIRVVCANTWATAIGGAEAEGTGSRQSHRSKFSNEVAARGLGFDLDKASNQFLAQVETIHAMNDLRITDAQAAGFFRLLLRPDLAEGMGIQDGAFSLSDFEAAMGVSTGAKDREVRGVSPLMDAYNAAPGARPGTARGLWEAATYYVDHVRGKDDDRINSAAFGQGREIKARAWANATRLVTA